MTNNTIYIDDQTGKGYILTSQGFVELEMPEPELGKIGDQDEIDREDAEREAQAAKEAEEDDEVESEEDTRARWERVQRSLEDADLMDKAAQESEEKVEKQKRIKADKEAKKYRSSQKVLFINDLNRFIKNELTAQYSQTWKVPSRRLYGTGLIGKGTVRQENKNIPKINVYFDHSGSWDEEKIKVGQDAIGTLNQYERKGQIKIDVYYFGNRVSSTPDGTGSGTRGTPIMEHIKQTNPSNVIIMTDSDIRDVNTSTTVPGAVWLLWKGGESDNLRQHIHGQKQTKEYTL